MRYSASALSMCVVTALSVGFLFKYKDTPAIEDVSVLRVFQEKRRALLRNADECDVPAIDWPCPGPKGTPGAEGVISFCENRFDDNFFYKCNCLPGYVAVSPVPNGQVMLDDAMVPSIGGIPISFRPVACLLATVTPSAPFTLPPSTSLAPSLAPSTEASTVVCSRGCEAPRDVCLADESLLLGDGKYKCTCLYPYVRAVNGDGCRKLTADDLIEDGGCDVCGPNALCVINEPVSFASVSCVCPTGFDGGAYTGCYLPGQGPTVSPAPVVSTSTVTSPTPATTNPVPVPATGNATQRLLLEAFAVGNSGPSEEEDQQLMEGDDPCLKVNTVLTKGEGDSLETRQYCVAWDAMELIKPDCSEAEEKVPKIYHSISGKKEPSYVQKANALANPTYEARFHDDTSGLKYIHKMCGDDVAEAYRCIRAPAYRGDIFRYCAMYAEGGVYMDEDMVLLKPMEEVYSTCSGVTIGHDQMPGKQMKILASSGGHPIFKCALDAVIENVKTRAYPGPLLLSGPDLLSKCYDKHSDDVAITYKDTRGAEWPYTGMRAGNDILAYEKPPKKSFERDESDYGILFENRQVYADACLLGVE